MKSFFSETKNIIISLLCILVIYRFISERGTTIEVNRLEQRIERYELNKRMYEYRIDSLSTIHKKLKCELDSQRIITNIYIGRIDSIRKKYEKDINFDNVSDDELIELFSKL